MERNSKHLWYELVFASTPLFNPFLNLSPNIVQTGGTIEPRDLLLGIVQEIGKIDKFEKLIKIHLVST